MDCVKEEQSWLRQRSVLQGEREYGELSNCSCQVNQRPASARESMECWERSRDADNMKIEWQEQSLRGHSQDK